MFKKKQVDEKITAHLHSGILFSSKKRCSSTNYYYVDGSRNFDTEKVKKSGTDTE